MIIEPIRGKVGTHVIIEPTRSEAVTKVIIDPLCGNVGTQVIIEPACGNFGTKVIVEPTSGKVGTQVIVDVHHMGNLYGWISRTGGNDTGQTDFGFKVSAAMYIKTFSFFLCFGILGLYL